MPNKLTTQALNEYGAKLSTFCKVALVALLLVVVPAAFAQTTPTVTFGTSVTNANGSLTTVNTWSTAPLATNCTASGHPSWTGTKAGSGTQSLPAITLSGTYSLTLACTWASDSGAVLDWIAPTVNTDGSALVKCASASSSGPCLAYFRIYRRNGSADLTTGAEVTPVNDPNATRYTFGGLAVGTHYFGIEVVNGNGVPSKITAADLPKTVAAATTRTASVTLTVNPVPGEASGIVVR